MTARGGDCYESAFHRLMEYERRGETAYLVHAEVSGQEELAGRRFGHAWVERVVEIGASATARFVMVEDHSNGREIELPRGFYYDVGCVVEEPGKWAKYTYREAARWATRTGHYGSWELDCEKEG